MTRIGSDTSSVNADFAVTVINRAAEGLTTDATTATETCDVFGWTNG